MLVILAMSMLHENKENKVSNTEKKEYNT
jgi:hypothetical protein